jgi:hypothetical protein
MRRRGSASERRRARSLLFAALGLSLAGVVWLAMAWLMQRFQAMRCPEATFFWASNQIATALQVVPLAFPAIAVGFWLAHWVASSLPAGLDRFHPTETPRRADAQRQIIRLSLIMLALTLPVSFAASLRQFCLEPHGIAYQATPWSGFRTYGWDEVSSVTTTCRYRSGRRAGWTKQLIVAMRDGAAIDLMTWPAAAHRAYPAIAQALRGQEFSFDASGVAPRCPEPYLSILARRP